MSDLAAQAQNDPAFQLHLQARVSGGELHFATDNLNDMARVMAFFNLVPPPVATDKVATEGNGGKKAGKKADTPPASTAPAAAGSAAATPAPAASAPSETSSVKPEQAAQAVREYGAKNGIDQARALLKKHGCEKTADITAEKAPAIFAEATGTAAPETVESL